MRYAVSVVWLQCATSRDTLSTVVNLTTEGAAAHALTREGFVAAYRNNSRRMLCVTLVVVKAMADGAAGEDELSLIHI